VWCFSVGCLVFLCVVVVVVFLFVLCVFFGPMETFTIILCLKPPPLIPRGFVFGGFLLFFVWLANDPFLPSKRARSGIRAPAFFMGYRGFTRKGPN